MRMTRHNGRAGKNGVYNPKHNDRRFDIGNSEHIDPERNRTAEQIRKNKKPARKKRSIRSARWTIMFRRMF